MSYSGNPYFAAAEIVSKLKAEMPVSIKLHDPISGQPYEIARDNILRALVIDTPNILAEAQTVAMYYGEMARAQRAAERSAASAERAFVKWKAQTAAAARKAAGKSGQKLTNDQASEAYRTDPKYEEMANLPIYYEKLAGLFEDLKRAFDIKSRMIDATMRTLGADFRTKRTESLAEMEEEAAKKLAESRSGRTARPF